jgi:hypothetical protein
MNIIVFGLFTLLAFIALGLLIRNKMFPTEKIVHQKIHFQKCLHLLGWTLLTEKPNETWTCCAEKCYVAKMADTVLGETMILNDSLGGNRIFVNELAKHNSDQTENSST